MTEKYKTKTKKPQMRKFKVKINQKTHQQF